jgi:hypothetical protein
MSEETPDKPKIIVDEDWKSQVQAEKDSAKQAPQPDEQGAQHASLPEPSFSQLVTLLATQAAAALGQGAPSDQEEILIDLGIAKHLIDLLEVLEVKTKGNLTPEENDMLGQVLHSLRMLFVAYKQHADKQHADNKSDQGGSSIVTE